MVRYFDFKFQLHHTGIKTAHLHCPEDYQSYFNCTIQELKRSNTLLVCRATKDFNCTIQELKPEYKMIKFRQKEYFNCTIQELKQMARLAPGPLAATFQLHHTGIKT